MPPFVSDAPSVIPAHAFPVEIEAQPESAARQMASMLERYPDAYYLGPGYPSLLFNSPPGQSELDRYLKILAMRGERGGSLTWPEKLKLLGGTFSQHFKDEFLKLKANKYGYGPTKGENAVRETMTQVLNDDMGVRLNPGRVTPTHGNTQALHAFTMGQANWLFRKGLKPAVIVDERTYTGALALFKAEGIAVYSAKLDGQGPDIDSLREARERAIQDGYHPMFYYTMPDGHNPTGISFSLERRRAIVTFLKEAGLPCFEDNAYSYLTFPGNERLPPLAALDDAGLVVYAITLSKIFSPGLRMALMHVPYDLELPSKAKLDFSGFIQAKVGRETLFSNNVAWLGLEAYLRGSDGGEPRSLWALSQERAAYYRRNWEILRTGLAHYFSDYPELFRFRGDVQGGFFTEARYFQPDTLRDFTAANLAKYLLQDHGVVTMSQDDFIPDDAKRRSPAQASQMARLCFSYTKAMRPGKAGEELTEAVNRLGAGMRQAYRLQPRPPMRYEPGIKASWAKSRMARLMPLKR